MINADVEAARRWRAFRENIEFVQPAERARLLSEVANQNRITDLEMIVRAGLGHVGGDMSVMDVLTVLYGAVLRVDPEKPEFADRDRFVLSKGHTAGALYVTLAWAGFFPADELAAFAGPLSPLNGHPNRVKVPGVETNTGPLGHGLPVAVGMAVAARMDRSSRHVYVVCGDGELQEGSNWEAAMTAGHRQLTNLTLVVDRNRLQQGARVEDTVTLEPLADKWRSFGWHVIEIDGHDHRAILEAVTFRHEQRPTCVIAHTIKGKGISFMEDRVEWHHKVPSAEQVELARTELHR
jgi:transketolase